MATARTADDLGRAMIGQLYDAVCGESAVARDCYLTWLAPGRPFHPGATAELAELVDGVGETGLAAVYADILRRCRVVCGELSGAEQLKVQRYRTLLRTTATRTDPATGEERQVTDDGPMLRAYHEHHAAYLAAELRCNLARAAGGAGWELHGDRYRAQVGQAMDDWLGTGYRDEVEQVHAYLDQLNRRDLVRWRGHLVELYDGGIVDGRPRSTVVPADLDTGWCDYALDADALDPQPRVRPTSWRAGSADFGFGAAPAAELPGFAISCQLALAVVSRPWFFPSLLDDRGWALPDGEQVCDGGDPPSGRLVGYPTAVLFARELRITSPEVVAAHRSGATPAWGPFRLAGATADGPSLTVPGIQAVGFLNRPLGRTPDPWPELDQRCLR